MGIKLDTNYNPFLRVLNQTQGNVYSNCPGTVSHSKDFPITMQSKVTQENDLLSAHFMQTLKKIRESWNTALAWKNYQSGKK